MDEFPKPVYKAQEQEYDQSLSKPFRKCATGRLDFAARYRGIIAVRSEGAIAWRGFSQPNGVMVRGWGFAIRGMLMRRRIYGRVMVVAVVMVMVRMIRLGGIRWWGRWWIV
jgi:hypothetical protein